MISNKILKIPLSGPICGKIKAPTSKSLSNRALIAAALSKGESCLYNFLHSDDTIKMLELWKSLGIKSFFANENLFIRGLNSNIPASKKSLHCGDSGIIARFIPPILSVGNGAYLLEASDQMTRRPMKGMIKSLRSIGANINLLQKKSSFPMQILGKRLSGGEIKISGAKTSQYVSGLLLSAPLYENGLRIIISKSLVSNSYIEMTRYIMKSFGVESFWRSQNCLEVPKGQAYYANNYVISGDASSVAPLFCLAAITSGSIEIEGLNLDSFQSDFGILKILETMGCKINKKQQNIFLKGGNLRAISVDMKNMTDIVPCLAMVALFAKGKTYLNNIGHMKYKESNRIEAICHLLKLVGAKFAADNTSLSIEGLSARHGACLPSFDDHRIAMAGSLLGAKLSGTEIINPNCINKTYPNYFKDFFKVIK